LPLVSPAHEFYSFFNHSCAPKTNNIVVGELMVLRAAEDVEAGEQLTVTCVSLISIASQFSLIRRQPNHRCTSRRIITLRHERSHHDIMLSCCTMYCQPQVHWPPCDAASGAEEDLSQGKTRGLSGTDPGLT
jgi:hypothetical protein